MSDIQDAIHQEIGRALARRPGIKAATITSYDPDRHMIKATIEPDGFETGWFPPHTIGLGIAIGQSIGDQLKVGFLDGDLENPVSMGPLHSDKSLAPRAESKELVISRAGATVKIDKNGNISHQTSGTITTTVSGVSMTVSASGITTQGGTVTIS